MLSTLHKYVTTVFYNYIRVQLYPDLGPIIGMDKLNDMVDEYKS